MAKNSCDLDIPIAGLLNVKHMQEGRNCGETPLKDGSSKRSPATLPDAYKKKVRGTKKNRQHLTPNQPHYNISKGNQHAAHTVYSGDRVLLPTAEEIIPPCGRSNTSRNYSTPVTHLLQ